MEFFKYYSKKDVKSKNRRSSKEVAYTRRGVDYVEALGSGFAGKKRIPTVWVTAKNGEKWEIPIDPKTGKVPNEYIVARFLATHQGGTGDRQRNLLIDLSKDAEVIHEAPNGGFTPEQLIATGWWQHPNSCDILDVDDTGSAKIFAELEEASKTAKTIGKKMACMSMSDASAKRVRDILAKDFNASELKRAVKDGGLIIKEGNPGRGAAACYYPKWSTSSLKTPVIILGKNWSEEDLVHEFIHHLRHVDTTRDGLTRSPFKFNEQGERVPMGNKSESNSARNLEEAATVGESYVRTHKIEGANGYYTRASGHGDTPDQRSKYDRSVLVPEGSKPLRGRKAEKQITAKFRDTSISHLGYYRPGSNAVNYLDKREKAGTMPKAVRPVKKKSSDMTKGIPSGPVGATANRNRRAYRARK